MTSRDPNYLFFATPAEWREWLAEHHARAVEAWVGFYKVDSGRPSLTWREAVDEALCFGWIDGLRRSIDETSYSNRFTPRRPTSTWSLVNVRRVAELTKSGRMQPAGLKAYANRTEDKTGIYTFEQSREAPLPEAYADRFRSNRPAWAFFKKQAPWYQRTAVRWVLDAKREETRGKRLAILIADSAEGRTIALLTRKKA